jgi:hypothetical protein
MNMPLAILAIWIHGLVAAAASRQPADCSEWQACRELAQAAAERGDYERFHDLAWRAVQTGPRRDASLMYLLARAQALSGRPHDALIMLNRIADMGTAPADAASDDAFARTRELPGWPEFEARLGRSGTPERRVASPGPARSLPATPATPPAARPEAAPITAAGKESLRFSAPPFEPAGLAYDGVSGRLVVGDRLGRKLMVVGDASPHLIDLVRSESAGFNDIGALQIDTRRGDLWVISGAEHSGTLHRVQLVSGRPLKSYRTPDRTGALADVSVTKGGSVVVLDGSTPQLLILRPGAGALERLLSLDAPSPVSVAAGDDEAVVYVAHADGLTRIDLPARTAKPLSVAQGVSLTGLEQIRSYRQQLIATRVNGDGAHEIVRVELNGAGTTVTRISRLYSAAPGSGPLLLTIDGDELVYLTGGGSQPSAASTGATPNGAELVAYRLRLK